MKKLGRIKEKQGISERELAAQVGLARDTLRRALMDRYLRPTQTCLRSALLLNSCFNEDSFASLAFYRLRARASFSTGLTSVARYRVTHGMFLYIYGSIDVAVMGCAAVLARPKTVREGEILVSYSTSTA